MKPARAAALLTLALFAILPMPAWAQEAETTPPVPEEDTAATPEAEDAPLSSIALDDLYARLGASDKREATMISKELAERWARSGSDTIDLMLQRGRKAMGKGELDKAIAHFSRLIAFAPEFAEGWNARATAYFANGEFGHALADVYRVLRLEPRHYGAMTGLGIMLEQLDMDEAAYRAYESAVAVHPHLESAKEGMDRLRKGVEGEPI